MTTCYFPIMDWRTRDEDLPDVPPGGKYERVITPQKHVVLRKILSPSLKLTHLAIGPIIVPFEICDEDGALRTYRPAVPADDRIFAQQLAGVGAQWIAPDAIRVVAGMDVRVILRNDRAPPAKPRVALMVEEEIS